jgi:hypothetical protein
LRLRIVNPVIQLQHSTILYLYIDTKDIGNEVYSLASVLMIKQQSRSNAYKNVPILFPIVLCRRNGEQEKIRNVFHVLINIPYPGMLKPKVNKINRFVMMVH